MLRFTFMLNTYAVLFFTTTYLYLRELIILDDTKGSNQSLKFQTCINQTCIGSHIRPLRLPQES